MLANFVRTQIRSIHCSPILSAEKLTGTVKWFDSKKGFGFISPDVESGLNGDVFVHQSNIVSATGFRTLTDGLPVSFFSRPDKSGKVQAFEITMADGSPVKVDSSRN